MGTSVSRRIGGLLLPKSFNARAMGTYPKAGAAILLTLVRIGVVMEELGT